MSADVLRKCLVNRKAARITIIVNTRVDEKQQGSVTKGCKNSVTELETLK